MKTNDARIERTPSNTPPAPPCCTPREEESCCAPEEKETCCAAIEKDDAPAVRTTCGCR